MIRRFYFENTLSNQLDPETSELCMVFKIHDKLDQRPSVLNSMEVQAAIVIREMIKKPKVLLLNRPEDFIGHTNFDLLGKMLGDWIANRLPVVFLSYDRRLVRRFANRKILITNGSLTTITIRQQPTHEETDTDEDAYDPSRKE